MEEHIATLQKEIQELKDTLQNETDSTVRDGIKEKIEEAEKLMADQQSRLHEATEATVEHRRSERERVPTEKMLAYQQEELGKKEKRLVTLYDQWKILARTTRQELKTDLSEDRLSLLIDPLEKAKNAIIRNYDEIRDQIAPSTQLRRRIDACEAVTKDIIQIIYSRITEVDGGFDPELVKGQLRELLDCEYARSIYGSSASQLHVTNNPAVTHSDKSKHSVISSDKGSDLVASTNKSKHSAAQPSVKSPSVAQVNVKGPSAASSIISQQSAAAFMATKRADAAAELATKEAEYKALDEERRQRERIRNIKEQLKFQESELEKIQKERDLKAARARFEVYNREV